MLRSCHPHHGSVTVREPVRPVSFETRIMHNFRTDWLIVHQKVGASSSVEVKIL